MSKSFTFCSFLCAILSTVAADAMIGPGKWSMLKMEKKSTDFDKFVFDIVQRKYNRTHDIFQGTITFHEELNDFFGARLDICKYVDGGCKQYQVVSDERFGSLIEKFAASNFKEMLQSAGCEDPKFPMPMGTYKIDSYMWNWDEMPKESPYGRYLVHCCVMEVSTEVGCIDTEVMFEEVDEEE